MLKDVHFSLDAPGIFCKVAGKHCHDVKMLKLNLVPWKLTFGIIFG